MRYEDQYEICKKEAIKYKSELDYVNEKLNIITEVIISKKKVEKDFVIEDLAENLEEKKNIQVSQLTADKVGMLKIYNIKTLYDSIFYIYKNSY